MKLFKKIKELFLDVVFTITHPDFWVMLDKYDPEVDGLINMLAEYHVFKEAVYDIVGDKNKAIAFLGDQDFWVANYPFACFSIKGKRPSRRTIYRLKKKLDRERGNCGYKIIEWDTEKQEFKRTCF